MDLFRNIRLKIGNALLHSKVSKSKRKASYNNIDLVKNIGIVWDATSTDEFALLSKFHQRMSDNKAEVNILGYYSGTSLPNQYTAIRYLSIVKKEELNFFYHPVSADSTNGNTAFDLMMDIKNPVNVEDYLNQVIHYLEMIKS